MSYKDLEIWRLARQTSIAVHKMSLTKLPKFELYETGSQIRRSSKSVRSNIVEAYGRRRYKSDYIKFLTYAFASCLETQDHIESLAETESLTDQPTIDHLTELADKLGRKLNNFIQAVERQHRTT